MLRCLIWITSLINLIHDCIVRSESTLLKGQIEETMPNLKVKMIPADNMISMKSESSYQYSALQGQVSEWTMRISNQGNAPAEKIMLKTNVPWINILRYDNNDSDIHETFIQSNSFCVGPTGTLVQVPLNPTGTDSDLLMPGETVDIRVQMRTSGGGKQDFYMLFRYQLSRNDAPHSIPQVRWLRNMLSVAVYPSLTVTASLIPSYDEDSDNILSLEVRGSHKRRAVYKNVHV